jgi:hypothetical protein
MHYGVDSCEFSNCFLYVIVGQELELDASIRPLHVPSKCCTDIFVNLLGGSRGIKKELDRCQNRWLLR